MDHENPDAASPPPPRMFSRATLTGVVCFGIGLLVVAGGVLLAAQWLFAGDVVALFVGLLLVFVGIATNITGLVLLYRGATRPGQGTENRNETP
ncbi:hypothetical protein [Mycetocola sp.]|uniref:hypothetical protein n=1 Tax=Mycetocola sp. TaxID=1871042 RepID=UPI003988CD5A